MLDGLYVGEGRCTPDVQACFNNVLDPNYATIMAEGQSLYGGPTDLAIAALSEALDGSLLWIAEYELNDFGGRGLLELAEAIDDFDNLAAGLSCTNAHGPPGVVTV
jgi:hypothetical protein